MKKAAICTLFFRNYNYGGILQCFALYKIVEDMGFQPTVIALKKCKNPIYTSLLTRCQQYSLTEIVSKLLEKFKEKSHSGIRNILSDRFMLFERFIAENIKSTYSITDDNLNDLGNMFDVIISGSDQVWNPNAVTRAFLQEFEVKSECRKISYAASISRNTLSEREKKVMIPAISMFNAVSVREITAKKILDEENINDVEVVLDPTLLLGSRQWNTYVAPPMCEKPYVLIYSFSAFPYEKELLDKYTKEGVEVLYIPYAKQEYNYFDTKSRMKPVWNVGPSEFLSLIKNADVVYTDSFHGTVFSIIFKRNFIVYERDGEKQKISKNSRLYDLLDGFGLKNRLVKSYGEINDLSNIDYVSINNKLEKYREHSIKWLNSAINKNDTDN